MKKKSVAKLPQTSTGKKGELDFQSPDSSTLRNAPGSRRKFKQFEKKEEMVSKACEKMTLEAVAAVQSV